MPISEVKNIDCMEYMKGFPDKFFELAIVDPPYGIGNWVQDTGNVRGDKVTWNDYTPLPEYFTELKRVSVEQIIWGANYYNCFNEKGGAIIWDKKNPNPNFSQCEIASYSRLKRVAYYEYAWGGVNDGIVGRVRKDKAIHPCEKPVQLYKWLLSNYAKEGDKILDTHLGSGSSRIAAFIMGFDFYGCEIDKDYFEAMEKRFKEQTAQQSLFEYNKTA
jgi:site-specific DNA-methyltransferase (adenine-specific)